MGSVHVICEGHDFTAPNAAAAATIVALMDLAFHNGQVESFYMPHTPAPRKVVQPQPVHRTLTCRPFEMHTPRDL